MNKRLTFLIFSLLWIQYGNAQLSLGIEGGINYSTVDIQSIFNIDVKNSLYFFGGITPKYSFNSKFAVIPSVNYAAKGYQIDNGTAFPDSKFRYSYLVFSGEVEYKVVHFLGIAVGLYDALKLGEAQNIGGDGWDSTQHFGTIKKSDIGFIGSVRAYYKQWFVKLSYAHGFKNINDIQFTDDNGQPLDLKQYNRCFQAGIGYLFDFSKD